MRKISAALRFSLVAAVVATGSVAVGTATAGPRAQTAQAGAFTATGSARQVHVSGLTPGAQVALLNAANKKVAQGKADALGSLIFYKVKAGDGYRVQVLPSGATSAPVTVHTEQSAPWDPSVYDQTIPDNGYGYLTTRDGTKLAYYVHPPTSPAGVAQLGITPPGGLPVYTAPYPTLIEYSGYGYANPAGPESGIAAILNVMGFAVVDVNMRGTGCSGGAYNFFEPLQNLDAYDVIETVARQSWVKDHKVGMEGISFGGISQLFTAQTQPPSLEAIAPLSVIDATATTLYPGGIVNDGFAVAWADERQQNAEAATAPGRGQAWAYKQIQSGDKTCKANQTFHGQAQNLLATIAANSHYHAAYADSLDPITFVNKIDVPVFMACQFTDEQTGGHCADLASHFTGTTKKWFTFTNGAHIDSLDPETINRMYDFLELYVDHQAPAIKSAVVQAAAPVIYKEAMGVPTEDAITLPMDPIQAIPTYSGALQAFEALPSIRVMFDNGAGASPDGQTTAGNPYPGFEQSFSSFPIPGTVAQQWYLGPGGSLNDTPSAVQGIDRYTSNPKALPHNDFSGSTEGGGLWGNSSQWNWQWKQNPAGTAVSYVTSPLTTNTTVIGAGSLDMWVRSSTPDVDLQVTISEVSPDGNETFVQDGWLRASERKLAKGANNIFRQVSTPLAPVLSMLQSDSKPMPKNKFAEVVVPLYYEGHVYRAGSRIRITIAAPNGTQPIWSFSHTMPNTKGSHGLATVSIVFSPKRPSRLTLPVVPSVNVTTSRPPCGSLRDEPCRHYVAMTNLTAKK